MKTCILSITRRLLAENDRYVKYPNSIIFYCPRFLTKNSIRLSIVLFRFLVIIPVNIFVPGCQWNALFIRLGNPFFWKHCFIRYEVWHDIIMKKINWKNLDENISRESIGKAHIKNIFIFHLFDYYSINKLTHQLNSFVYLIIWWHLMVKHFAVLVIFMVHRFSVRIDHSAVFYYHIF